MSGELQLTYLLTYLLAYLLTYLPTYLFTYLPTYTLAQGQGFSCSDTPQGMFFCNALTPAAELTHSLTLSYSLIHSLSLFHSVSLTHSVFLLQLLAKHRHTQKQHYYACFFGNTS